LVPFTSVIIIIFLYFGTYWRVDLKSTTAKWEYDILVFWIFVCFIRSAIQLHGIDDLKTFLFSNYMGLSLFPVLFFIVGVNINYFFSVNKILTVYFVLATLLSLVFINHFEFQLFILFPIFYIIITIPLRNSWERLFIILVSISIVIVSLTNRAGILRILISYLIVIAYYVIQKMRVNKKLLKFIVFCLLMIPVVSLYLGIKGQSVFQVILGRNEVSYSQINPSIDTRTFLYYEVFQDLKSNEAFIFGKGLNAGYASQSFETFSRPVVEVGFLQILLKTGIVGFVLYITVLISAVFKALGKSSNSFVKSLGLLLAGYVLLLFVENIIAYNLLNIIIWIIVGMCHSEALRGLSTQEMKHLFTGKNS